VLILDEPTVGLDPNQIREMRKLIKDLGGDHTVLLSTHILPEVEAICDHVIIIAGGRIVAKGSLEQLKESRKAQARVLVECQGPAGDVKSALERVAGVAKVEMLDCPDKGYALAALKAKDGYDVRGEAARTVVQKGWPIREVKLEHATLEEFFVQVTANQAMGTVEEMA
jgi:ABC-2 type transport system ATP-binding protein